MNIDITLIVRKTGHFFVFFLLSYFFYTIVKNIVKKKSSIYIWVLFLCLLIGVIDEFSQSFMPDRTSSVRDVVIDFTGACCFFVIKKISDLFDKFVKYIIGILFRNKGANANNFKK